MMRESLDARLLLAAFTGLTLAASCKSHAEPSASAPSGSATLPVKAEKACCKGLNDCKGKGGCAVPGKHDCAAQNACRGQGGCNMHCPGK